MISADRAAYPTGRSSAQRGRRPTYDPLAQQAQRLANTLWERASALAAVLAPENPVDQEPLSDHESWLLLEAVAVNLSPALWDDPNALSDLYRLRKSFMPELATESLQKRAAYVKKTRAMLPDPSITPENPEFERRVARLKR